jgi:cardiolipin synthase
MPATSVPRPDFLAGAHHGRLRKTAEYGVTAALGAQAAVVAAASTVDYLRKRHRPVPAPVPAPTRSRVGEDQLTTYSYGAELYADMLAAIRGAEDEVCFETFIWKGDDLGREFKTALVEAAERGVRVYLMFDGFANLVVPARFKRFPEVVQVLEYPAFAPGWRFFDPRRYGRDHRKILVVDGRVGFVGGYNVGGLYARGWRDTHLRIEGPSTWSLRNAFIDFWNRNRQAHHPTLDEGGAPTWDPHIRVRRNMPRMRMFPIRGMYLEALDRARKHVYLTHAYFIPDRQILEAVLAAARRGVDVQLLLPTRSNHALADWLSRGYYETLLRAGVRIFLFDHAMVHAKTATIDGEWSTVGTANIDRVSLAGNYEVNVEVFSPEVAADMERIFAGDREHARELSLQEWERRHVTTKLSEHATAPLRPRL